MIVRIIDLLEVLPDLRSVPSIPLRSRNLLVYWRNRPQSGENARNTIILECLECWHLLVFSVLKERLRMMVFRSIFPYGKGTNNDIWLNFSKWQHSENLKMVESTRVFTSGLFLEYVGGFPFPSRGGKVLQHDGGKDLKSSIPLFASFPSSFPLFWGGRLQMTIT